MKNMLVVLSMLVVVSGCGSFDKKDDSPNNSGGQVGLKSADLTELQSTPPTQSASLVAAYGYRPTSTIAAFFGLYTGNRYLSGAIQLVGNNVYRMEASSGFYVESNGAITTTAKKITCPGITPGGSVARGPNDSMIATVGSTTTILARITDTTPPANGLVIQWGCFDGTTGAFTQHAWADIP